MTIEVWFAFALASTVVLMIPGPTVLLVCAYALGAGRRTALWTVGGVALGDLVAMTAAVTGLGALLAASATLFSALKIAGGFYLIWLGVKLWRSSAGIGDLKGRQAEASGPRIAGHAFAVTATNPKSIVFFISFTPQFIDPAAALTPQLAIMVATFVILATVNAGAYALAAGTLREKLRQPRVLRALNRGGGAALIGMGALTAASSRVLHD